MSGTATSLPEACPVCGGVHFEHQDVLNPELVAAWGLSAEEVRYIDAQQGTHCVGCGANVRSMALAKALLALHEFKGILVEFVADVRQQDLRVLEINEAGTLHPVVSRLPGHRLVAYPEFDMTRPVLRSEAFDLVLHSDTLEHVPDPLRGLQECYRLLDAGGALIFTIPIVLGRLTRHRRGLPPSFHGPVECTDPGMLVHTEFGADAWTLVLQAGFSSCELIPLHFPAGVAIVARK